MSFLEKEIGLPSGFMNFRVGGAGPPLLYLHGAGGARLSEPLQAFTRMYRVYAPILPGFDGTPRHEGVAEMPGLADLIAAFAAKEIPGAGNVIGHSFGGLLAMWLALRHPTAILRLVLGCPAGIVAGEPPPPDAGPEEMRRRLHAHPERIPLEERSPATMQANRATAGHYYARGFMTGQLIANLEQITCPTLILAGAGDRIVPPETGLLLRVRLPQGQLVSIPDAAHDIESDQPLVYERLVADFLADGAVLRCAGAPESNPGSGSN